MNKTVSESVSAARRIALRVTRLRTRGKVEVAVAPGFTALDAVGRALRGGPVRLAAQNAHWETEGGFTGEISPAQLKSVGCWGVLIGHSERRLLFGETDEGVSRRLAASLRAGLCPILCVGESWEEREAGKTAAVLKNQLVRGASGIPAQKASQLIVAYEPVWAIGTGRSAARVQISEVHSLIRKELAGMFGTEAAEKIRILYGGSVTPDNIADLAADKTVDGVLVGGASLRPETLSAIVAGVQKAKKEE